MKRPKQNVKAFIIAFLTITVGYSQLPVPFKVRYQSYINGDMTIIANTITNRTDYSNSPNVPYHNHTNHARLNDEFYMEYIDIDNDQTTFSSSSATLNLPNQANKKIVYAGLYWSSTYKYNSGDIKKEGKYNAIDEDRESIENIKIKLPNQNNYISVNGEVIFDGLGKKEFKDCAPYAVYADITDEVKKAKNPFGEYTIANIKATQGKLSGGVASGWTLFIVYEDASMKGKFITSFDGFAGVTDRQVDINFSGFETLPEGDINAKIALASLEGDRNLLGDQILFKSAVENNFITLENTLRKANNFFNSSITIDDNFYADRKPDGKNTLGFDACLMKINNPNNSIIGNNANQAILRLKSSGDRCYMFFAAFNVEVTEKFKLAQPVTEPLYASLETNKNEIKKVVETTIKNTPVELKLEENDKLFDKEVKIVASLNKKEERKKQKQIKKANKKKTNEDIMSEFTDEVSQIEIYEQETYESASKNEYASNDFFNSNNFTEIKYINLDNVPSGYYIIANVFEIDMNLKNFLTFLKSKQIEADSFYNPENKYNYVYLAKTKDREKAFELYNNKINNTYKEHIWILSVNTQHDSAVTNLDD